MFVDQESQHDELQFIIEYHHWTRLSTDSNIQSSTFQRGTAQEHRRILDVLHLLSMALAIIQDGSNMLRVWRRFNTEIRAKGRTRKKRQQECTTRGEIVTSRAGSLKLVVRARLDAVAACPVSYRTDALPREGDMAC